MCGIFGVIAPLVDAFAVKRATHLLDHRGPDDDGMYVSPNKQLGLGHCRLSILDLSDAGRQPMSNEDETIWITYNGETYNFKQLREQLETHGHTFRSNTDTEVIIHAYEEWGVGCLRNLRGMFAFGLWDERKRRLFLARDRLGIKPLYYYWDGSQFVFASELKAIEAYPGVNLAIDQSALYDFLTYRYIPTPKTPYVNVRKLPPGHYLVLQDGKAEIQQYWDVDFNKVTIWSESEAQEGLKAHLEEAIPLHLISDVPVGVLLSGGIDSSCIAAFASKYANNRLKSFSIGFDARGFSETNHARSVARSFSTDHIEKAVTKEIGKELFSKVFQIYDEPFADSSALPTYAVSMLARKDVKVVLTGDGGDEVFGGYNWYTIFQMYNLVNYFPKSLVAGLATSVGSLPWRIRGKDLISTFAMEPMEFYTALVGGFTRKEKANLLRDRVFPEINVCDGYDDYWYFRQFWREDLDPVTRLQYLDLKTYLPDDILTKIDRASMAVSLEVRPPLLDHRLVEFMASVDAKIRNRFGIRKYLFKKTLAGILPKEIIRRKKQGFSPPLGWWLHKGDFFETSQMEELADKAGCLDTLRPSRKLSLVIMKNWLDRREKRGP